MSGTLWIVGTPIGNLADLAPRAREVLAAVDVIAAEDTRRTGRLLRSIGVRRELVSLFEGNERSRIEPILERLLDGDDVALVSDAGMPLVSDPGARLVRACVERGLDVRVVPGPSAALAALVVSGFATDRFTVEGFLPRKPSARMRRLEALRHDPRTAVVFEAPGRVHTLLRDVLVVLGDRRVALARELTKRHEEIRRGRASEVLGGLEEDVRGEVVLVIEGAREAAPVDLGACVEEVRELVRAGVRRRDAARAVGERRGVSANDLYEAVLAADDGSTG